MYKGRYISFVDTCRYTHTHNTHKRNTLLRQPVGNIVSKGLLVEKTLYHSFSTFPKLPQAVNIFQLSTSVLCWKKILPHFQISILYDPFRRNRSPSIIFYHIFYNGAVDKQFFQTETFVSCTLQISVSGTLLLDCVTTSFVF